MTNHNQLDDKLGEAATFEYGSIGKYRTSVILEEIDLDQYFSKEVLRARGRCG